MSLQMSKNLGELLESYGDDTPIDLRGLAQQVARQLESKSEVVVSLLNRVTGTMAPGTLFRYLVDGVAHDSAVRDVMTTGHLGKLLTRLDVLLKTSNPAIIGLPHKVFDAQSQLERAEFFAKGNILPIDAEILNENVVKEMLEREACKNAES
jgi:hypothetical protein